MTGAFGVRAFTWAVDLECARAFQARKADFAIESCVKGDLVSFAVPRALAQSIQSKYVLNPKPLREPKRTPDILSLSLVEQAAFLFC